MRETIETWPSRLKLDCQTISGPFRPIKIMSEENCFKFKTRRGKRKRKSIRTFQEQAIATRRREDEFYKFLIHLLGLSFILGLIITNCQIVEANSGPRITIQPNDLIAVEGESTELNCDAEGDPEPSIEWYHNEQLVRQSMARTTLGGSIQFLDVRSKSNTNGRESDAGIYYCLAKNPYGQVKSRNASLQVACKYIRINQYSNFEAI